MQQSIVQFYCFVIQTLLNMFRPLLCPSSGAGQTAVAESGFRMNMDVEVFSVVVGLLVPLANRPRLRTLPPPHSYGNQILKRQFDLLLMMGMVMPETCWAVSVRQSNKFFDWLLHLVGCFYLIDIHFFIISRPVLLRMKNVSDKSCRENQNTHFVFSNFFPKIVPFMR